MATKINSIISQAHQLAQLTSAEFSESPSGTQSAKALIELNNILQQLNQDQLIPFSKLIVSYTIPTSKSFYTIGVDSDNLMNLADIQYERPEYIGTILFRSSATSNPFRILPLSIEDVKANSSVTGTGTPRYFATNNLYPLSEIYFDLMPTVGAILEIIYNKAIPRYEIDDSLALPPSYNDLLVTALASRIAINANSDLINRIESLYQRCLSRITTSNSRNQIPLTMFENVMDADFGYNRALTGRNSWL